jgi:ABC-type uncharacterized transport system fused permease/ATPase subunit
MLFTYADESCNITAAFPTHTFTLYITCKQWLTKHLCEKYFANKSFFALKSGAYINDSDSTTANTSNNSSNTTSLYGNGATGVL